MISGEWVTEECLRRHTGAKYSDSEVEELVDQSSPSVFFNDNCTFHTRGTKIASRFLNRTNRSKERVGGDLSH